MALTKLLEKAHDDTAVFANLLGTHVEGIDTELLRHDGDIIRVCEPESNDHLLRALHECVTNQDQRVLIVSPNHEQAAGTKLLIDDLIEKSFWNKHEFDIERTTQTNIEFENGGVIKCTGPGSHDGNTMGGYNPYLLVLDNYDNTRETISDECKEEIIQPIFSVNGNVWINSREPVWDDAVVQAVLSDGAYVKTD